jgi:hypothetical protein
MSGGELFAACLLLCHFRHVVQRDGEVAQGLLILAAMVDSVSETPVSNGMVLRFTNLNAPEGVTMTQLNYYLDRP